MCLLQQLLVTSTSARWKNLLMRESLLLLQRKRTLDLCMPMAEKPPNDPPGAEVAFKKCKRGVKIHTYVRVHAS